jgi:hypothetical protein
MMNFAAGTITIYYQEDQSTTTGGDPRIKKTYVLNLAGNTVSLLKQQNTNDKYVAALAAQGPDTPQGDSRLYLKGGEGSMTIIDLFTPEELQELRNSQWLINEANLTFYIDKGAMANLPDAPLRIYEPERIYLYDLNNKRPIYDYSTDASTDTDAKRNRGVYGGIIEKDADKKGIKYKIRITNHIRNLIRKDSTNVRLGLVVTESIGITANSRLKTPVPLVIDRVPSASVMSPLGTILYGTNIPVGDQDYDKRLQLEIYYTKPN